ncbi:MAG: FHA domain-containing protein [Chloroflexota bacterium]
MSAHIHLSWHNSINETDSGHATVTLPLRIGRSQQNDLVLAGQQAGVSRQHARLMHSGHEIIVVDLESTNGTYVNGRRVRKTTLHNGAQVSIGNYVLTLQTLVRCNDDDCQRLVSSQQLTCPWCGHFLADAATRFRQF